MKKSVIAIISALFGAILGVVGTNHIKSQGLKTALEKPDKFRGYYNLLNEWLILKQDGKSLESYFIANEFKTIAIYGMGEIGHRLYNELKDSNVIIKYAIDKNAIQASTEINILDIDDTLDEVDAIVVCAIFAFDEIERELIKRVDYPVISLDEIVYEV